MADPKIEKFKKVLQMDPNDETLWFGLGKAYMADENWKEAIPALESCIKVKPTYSAAIFALAQCLKNNDQPDRCREVCAQGIDVRSGRGSTTRGSSSGMSPTSPPPTATCWLLKIWKN